LPRQLIQLNLRKGGGTRIAVDGWPGPTSLYHVDSSNVVGHPAAAEWPDALERRLKARRRDRGEHKGRILYAFQLRGLSRVPLPVGALLYHLADRRLQVLGLGTAVFKASPEREQIMALLLACAQEVARLHGAPSLEWMVHSERDAKSACDAFEFVRVKKNDPRRKRLRGNEILLERLPNTHRGSR